MGAISCIASIACAHLNVTRIAVHNQAKILVVIIRSIDNNTAAQNCCLCFGAPDRAYRLDDVAMLQNISAAK